MLTGSIRFLFVVCLIMLLLECPVLNYLMFKDLHHYGFYDQ